MTKVIWKDLKKEIQDKPKWADTLYKEKNGKRIQLTDLGKATWRIIYNDGKTVNGPKGYGKLSRSNVKSISIVDEGGTVLHTVQVKNNKFLICLRSMYRNRPGLDFHNNPKRCFILSTDGKIDYIWDDGDIDEMTEWGDEEPYTKPAGGAFDL